MNNKKICFISCVNHAEKYNTALKYIHSLKIPEGYVATGLPVITTNWSAHLDFINHTNGYLIDVKGYQKLNAWNTELLWAEPNKDHLRSLMRHVYMNQNEAENKGQLARETLLNSYKWSISAGRMMDRFREILS